MRLDHLLSKENRRKSHKDVRQESDSLVVQFLRSTAITDKRRETAREAEPGHGGVAQLGEHLPCKQGVMGSNPIISTKRVDPRVGH